MNFEKLFLERGHKDESYPMTHLFQSVHPSPLLVSCHFSALKYFLRVRTKNFKEAQSQKCLFEMAKSFWSSKKYFVKWGAPCRWSFCRDSTYGSKGQTSIRKAHPTLTYFKFESHKS